MSRLLALVFARPVAAPQTLPLFPGHGVEARDVKGRLDRVAIRLLLESNIALGGRRSLLILIVVVARSPERHQLGRIAVHLLSLVILRGDLQLLLDVDLRRAALRLLRLLAGSP